MSSSLKETDGTTTDGDWYELASWPTNTIIYSIWNGVKQVSNNSFTSNNLNLSYNGTTYNSLSDFNNSGVSYLKNSDSSSQRQSDINLNFKIWNTISITLSEVFLRFKNTSNSMSFVL